MADIIHSYCCNCLIIEEAPFKVCCDSHIPPTVYFKLSEAAGLPDCRSCILQDKPLLRISAEISTAVKTEGGICYPKDYIHINNRTLGHLIKDHGRTSIVMKIIPCLAHHLFHYLFAIIPSEGKEVQYFIEHNNQCYKVPVERKGSRWIIPSIYEITSSHKQQYLNKPRGQLIINPKGKRPTH